MVRQNGGVRRFLVAATAALSLALVGCSAAAPEAGPARTGSADPSAFLNEHDLGGMDGEQIIDHLDRLPVAERPTDLVASVHADQLLLADAEQEVVVRLDDDRFYLSIAPYVDQTHECFFHSLTTCRGELANQEIGVRIVDDATGDLVVDEQVTTFDNGFVGFWLPRDVRGTIEVTLDGLTGQRSFSSSDDDATCLTTLRLDES